MEEKKSKRWKGKLQRWKHSLSKWFSSEPLQTMQHEKLIFESHRLPSGGLRSRFCRPWLCLLTSSSPLFGLTLDFSVLSLCATSSSIKLVPILRKYGWYIQIACVLISMEYCGVVARCYSIEVIFAQQPIWSRWPMPGIINITISSSILPNCSIDWTELHPNSINQLYPAFSATLSAPQINKDSIFSFLIWRRRWRNRWRLLDWLLKGWSQFRQFELLFYWLTNFLSHIWDSQVRLIVAMNESRATK